MNVRPSHRRTAIVTACGWLLLAITRQLDHTIAPWGVSVWLGGLLIAFPSLRLSPQQGFNACVLLGLFADAMSPLPFGMQAFLFGLAHLIIVRVRNRFAASEPLIGTVVALIANLALYVAMTSFVLARAGGAPMSGARLLTDLVASQLLIGLIAPWFLALQEHALVFSRLGLQDEPVTAME